MSDKQVYLITGRVHPERYGLSIDELRIEATIGDLRCEMLIVVSQSQIAVTIVGDREMD